MKESKNKYEVGDTVYANENPGLKLVVRRYIDRVYYCTVPGNPGQKDLVYFEREIVNKQAEAHSA
jgi:hypothetical protein